MSKQTNKNPDLTRYITFYSYKGGVGRTCALANCARVLIAKGKRVVLMDLDLEAPGLGHFFKTKQKHPQGFAEYLDACLTTGIPKTLDDYIHPCMGEKNDEGQAWLMPAGRHGEAGYLKFLQSTTWNEFYTQQQGCKILENLRGHIIEQFKPDYVFIDARTGLSEIGGIATHQLADVVVLLFNLNQQNLDGAKYVFDSIKKVPAPNTPKVVLVASPIPVMPTEKGTPFFEKMQFIQKNFEKAENAERPLIIPYHPLLSFEDRLLVDNGDLFGSAEPYHRLVEKIQTVVKVDADSYLQNMTDYMQRGDWQQVRDAAQRGLAKNPRHIKLLWHLASAYYFLREHKQAIFVWDELIGYYIDSQELSEQEYVAKALINKGITLGEHNQTDNEIAAYNVLLKRFSGNTSLVLQELIMDAMLYKAEALEQKDDAIEICNKLLSHFANSDELILQEKVADALLYKGELLEQQEKAEDAIAVYDELFKLFANSSESVLQERSAQALFNKGAVLGQLGQSEAEMVVYDELLCRFAESKELVLQEPVAKAWNGKGFILLLRAKTNTDLNQRQQILTTALQYLEQALQVWVSGEDKATVLGNQAYTLFLLGEKEQCESILTEALALGGRELYEAELADSQLHPLPEDNDFRALLDKLWQAQNSQS